MGRDSWPAHAGAAVWLVLMAWRAADGLNLVVPLFLLAPLVLVPFGLRLVGEGPWLRIARAAQPLGAAGATLSFLLPVGPAVAAVAAAWLAVAAVLALHGLGRLWSRRTLHLPELCVDVGLLALPVGAGALVLSRLGAMPLGFGEPIVLLTAGHFHYAGFATLVLTGRAGRALATPRGAYRLAAVGTLTGTPMLAAGITLSPTLELAGAAVLVTALLLSSLITLSRIQPRLAPGLGRSLITVSAASVWVGMALAAAYAWGEFRGEPVLGLIDMARLHGCTKAIGYALCGLVGWARLGEGR